MVAGIHGFSYLDESLFSVNHRTNRCLKRSIPSSRPQCARPLLGTEVLTK
jgi:hypothetical protein